MNRSTRDPEGVEPRVGSVKGVPERHSVPKSVPERHTSGWLFGALTAKMRPPPEGEASARRESQSPPPSGPGEKPKREIPSAAEQVDVLH
jgi:hypothetical protein